MDEEEIRFSFCLKIANPRNSWAHSGVANLPINVVPFRKVLNLQIFSTDPQSTNVKIFWVCQSAANTQIFHRRTNRM
jgi:hypothetical protein